ncbi:MAG: ATP-binding protein [Paracoccaceae bacterium]
MNFSRSTYIGIAAAGLLAVTVVTGLFLGTETRSQFREISGSWSVYATGAEKKGVWISSIRGYLGYGGIIHTFKNYVIRGEDAYRLRMLDQLTQFNAVMESYLAEPLPVPEREALLTIRATIAEYESKLVIAERAARAGWPAELTDWLVRVDDTQAVLAFQDLERIWRESRDQSTQRIISAVGTGEALIGIGFMAMLALVLVALTIGFLLLLLVRDMHAAMVRLSDELTVRKRLETSELRLTEAVEQSPATILITDTQGHIQYANRRFEELSGWRRDEIVGQTPKLLQSGDTSAESYGAMRAALSRGERWHGVLRNLRRDGGSYWVETTILPLVDSDGVVRSYLGIGEDIGEKRHAREQLARAQKMEAVGLLAGGIAHDFNNILTTIIGSAHLAAMDVEPGSEIAGEVEQIDIAARRAQSLVGQLLVFARRQPGVAGATDMCAVITEVARLMSAAIPPTVRLEGAEGCVPVPVLADPTHLHQILMNLVGNAAEAIGVRPGVIRIAVDPLDDTPNGLAARAGGWVRVVVEDDGPGMSAETQAQIFDAFFTTKPLGKGTGLGLAVVHGLVDEIGGQIFVESTPGKGTSFTLILPGAEALALIDTNADEAIQRGHERILIVDDEIEIASTFRRYLMRLGYQVEAFTAPLVAVERVAANPERFDLLVSDMVMPGMDGAGLVKAIRAMRPDLPVIFCTGYNAAGISCPDPAPINLAKPIDPGELARHVRALLDASSQSVTQ